MPRWMKSTQGERKKNRLLEDVSGRCTICTNNYFKDLNKILNNLKTEPNLFNLGFFPNT